MVRVDAVPGVRFGMGRFRQMSYFFSKRPISRAISFTDLV